MGKEASRYDLGTSLHSIDMQLKKAHSNEVAMKNHAAAVQDPAGGSGIAFEEEIGCQIDPAFRQNFWRSRQHMGGLHTCGNDELHDSDDENANIGRQNCIKNLRM